MKIGFCCKHSELTGSIVESVESCNFKITTAAWLKRQDRSVAEQRLFDIVVHNLNALENSINEISGWHDSLKMFRIGSDILPFFTHKDYAYFYQQNHVSSMISNRLASIGEISRKNNIRLSFHPGQYCVFGSEHDHVIQNAIEEFEYHTTVAVAMGYGKRFQDFKINIHLSGKGGTKKFLETYSKLSNEARLMITVENEEFGEGGFEECLSISHLVPVVFDIHHHWVKTGEYVSHTDDRIKKVIDSWRGVRPAMHYSQPREEYIPSDILNINSLPDMETILSRGIKKTKLRAHSDYYWNNAVNDLVFPYSENFDIQCESKWKNIASKGLFDYFQK